MLKHLAKPPTPIATKAINLFGVTNSPKMAAPMPVNGVTKRDLSVITKTNIICVRIVGVKMEC